MSNAGPETERAFVATGAGFADALAGGPLAGAFGAPLYLSQKTCMPAQALESLKLRNPSLMTSLGGLSSISEAAYRTPC